MNLLHLIVRQWRRRPARTLLSILSVAIAASAVLGVTLAQTSVRLGYRKLLETVEGRPALEIALIEGGRFEPALVPPLADIAGVVTEIPIVTRGTMARVQGKRFKSVLLGVPSELPAVWEALTIIEGEPCRDADEVVVSADLAKSLKIEVGDRLRILTRHGPRSATVVGLVNSASVREFASAATLVMPLAAVQKYFDLGDRIDRIRVLVHSGDERSAVQGAISARLPKEFAAQAPVEQLELADSLLRSTELALRFAGALSMAMAAFIILNTLRMNFGERRRDMAILRVLGVTSQQLVALQLIEGFWLGLIGSILGIPLGLALGQGLSAAMRQLVAADIPAPEPPYWMLPVALVVGPAVACIAALLPALQSRNVSPTEAMGDPETRGRERFPLWAIATGLAMWGLAVTLLLLVMTERLSPEAAIPAGVLMLVGFIAVIPLILSPVVRASARLLQPLMQMEGDFAAEQLLERPTRTGLTVGVLVVAISTSLGMGNAIINNVNDVRQWFRRSMSGDLFLLAPSAIEVGAMDVQGTNPVRDKVAAETGVERVNEVRYFYARVGGMPAWCIVRGLVDGAELPWPVSTSEAAELREKLRSGEVVVGSVLAKKLGVHAGDELRFELQGRLFTLRVAATVRDYTLGGLVIFLDQATAAGMIDLGPPTVYIVDLKPGTPEEPLVARLEPLLSEEGLVVKSFSELRGQLDGMINGIVGALWGLLAIGFVIGGVAVGNTLTMSVLEQTRELGLLRIIGMTRAQVRKLIFCESLLLGILGTLMGTLAGFTTAWVIHLCNEPLLGQVVPFAFHGWLLLVNAGTCLLITILAAWSPGERAARLDLLAAIAQE